MQKIKVICGYSEMDLLNMDELANGWKVIQIIPLPLVDHAVIPFNFVVVLENK